MIGRQLDSAGSGYGPVRDLANRKMDLPIPCNKGDITERMCASTPDRHTAVPFIPRFSLSIECAMVISTDSHPDVPQCLGGPQGAVKRSVATFVITHILQRIAQFRRSDYTTCCDIYTRTSSQKRLDAPDLGACDGE